MTLSGTAVLQGEDTFSTVLHSMNFLLLQVLCGPSADVAKAMLDIHWVYYGLYLVFLLFANLTLMNMLIGILCDVVSNVAMEANEEAFAKEVESQLTRLASMLDEDKDGLIS